MNIFVEDLREELKYHKNKEQRLLKILSDCEDSMKISDHEIKPNIQRAIDKIRYIINPEFLFYFVKKTKKSRKM